MKRSALPFQRGRVGRGHDVARPGGRQGLLKDGRGAVAARAVGHHRLDRLEAELGEVGQGTGQEAGTGARPLVGVLLDVGVAAMSSTATWTKVAPMPSLAWMSTAPRPRVRCPGEAKRARRAVSMWMSAPGRDHS